MVNEELVGKQETSMDQLVLAEPLATRLISSIFGSLLKFPGMGTLQLLNALRAVS